MNRLKIVKNRFVSLPKNKKIQLSISIALTALLMIALPVVAWFANSKKTESMVKINAPTVLTIGAGADDAAEMIDLSDINVEEKVGETRILEGNYVFAIKGKYLSAYDLQIARTTNIPFTYEIYRVSKVELPPDEDDEFDDDEKLRLLHGLGTNNSTLSNKLKDGSYNGTAYFIAEYLSSADQKYYYPYTLSDSDKVSGVYLNDKLKSIAIAEGGTAIIGDGEESIDDNETFHEHNYSVNDNATYDNVNEYAEPLYWQAENLPVNYKKDNGDFVDYYVLKIKWTAGFSNNKETDMIYITARRH